MVPDSIEELAQKMADWELLKQLPASVGVFRLKLGGGLDGRILKIASYVSEAYRCRLEIIYTEETKDFVAVKSVGLHEFRDEELFSRDSDAFAAMFLAKLPRLLGGIDRSQPHAFPYEAQDLHFEKWAYWRTLPEKLGSYELFITPANPQPYINGSIIFLDYVDFGRGNEISFFYNVFRNEIFAELKRNYLPITTGLFDVERDVPDGAKLTRLGELLKAGLAGALSDLG